MATEFGSTLDDSITDAPAKPDMQIASAQPDAPPAQSPFLKGETIPALPPVQPVAGPPGSAYEAFKGLGATPGEMQLVHIESGFKPGQVTGSNVGYGQFSPDLQKKYGITDPDNPQQVLNGIRAERADFEKGVGRPLTDGEFYMMHQQGRAGGQAILNADPSTPAWQAVRQFYGSDAVAKRAIWGNVPDNLKAQYGDVDKMTAGQFAQLWTSRFGGGAPQPPAQGRAVQQAQDQAQPKSTGDKIRDWLRQQSQPDKNAPPKQPAKEEDEQPMQFAAIQPAQPSASVIRGRDGKIYYQRGGRVYDERGKAVG